MAQKKLTIVYVDLDDIQNPLLAGGQATATYEVGRRLVQKGHKVTVLCSKYPGYQDRVEAGIEYRHIGINTSNIKLNNFFFFVAAPWAVSRLKNVDVIVECFTAPISVLFSPLVTSIPVVALPSMFNAKEFSKKYHLPLTWIESWGVKFYRHMMPYSDIDQAKAKKLNPSLETRIISQGVGEQYLTNPRTVSKHILYLGRFDIAQKGIDLLLEAYHLVKDKISYPLVLAGHGPDEEKITAQIEKLGLSKSVHVVGSAYGEKKMKLMSESLFVAFPSRHDEICLWTLEALAGGLPLVAFDLPESRWIADSVALKAPMFDTKKFAQLLVDATNPVRNKKMSQASRAFARQYSWDAVVQKTEEFLQYIANRK